MPLKRNEERGALQEQWEESLQEAPVSAEEAELKAREGAAEPSAERETGVRVAPPVRGTAAAPAMPAGEKSAQLKRIESVLEEDLGSLYFEMDEAHRKMFKAEGEKTARAIDALISGAKAKAQKVLYLIRRWLMLIPGMNKFFLEQEAKIKTDKLMVISEERKTGNVKR